MNKEQITLLRRAGLLSEQEYQEAMDRPSIELVDLTGGGGLYTAKIRRDGQEVEVEMHESEPQRIDDEIEVYLSGDDGEYEYQVPGFMLHPNADPEWDWESISAWPIQAK